MAEIERAAREGHQSVCQELITDLDDHTALVIDELSKVQDKAA